MIRDIARLRAVWHSSAANYTNTGHLVTNSSDLPWISGGAGTEWLMIDLGTVSEIFSVAVKWGEEYAKTCRIEVSDDAASWQLAAMREGAPSCTVDTEVIRTARYVRLFLSDCSGTHYVIHRVCVFGENDLFYTLPDMPAPLANGTEYLTGGAWKLQRASSVDADGILLSSSGFDDHDWLPATVPGTALVSYLNAGAVPDPFYDDDQFQISEEFFTADFWYRDSFTIPAERKGRRVFLNFTSVNWKADVYFNGRLLDNTLPGKKHSIEGAFIRAKFDVTDAAVFGGENVLAVRILKNETPGEVTTQGLAFGPGPNGGLLGADNPTLHASVGWDWLPTIRGRNTGIIGDVFVSYGGSVSLEDPWMETNLPLISETTAIPMEDLAKRAGVTVDGTPGTVSEWRGRAGDSFTIDFGAEFPVGTVTLLWGTEAGGAAADFESRHPEAFRLEVSSDGTSWRNLDAYPGGTIEMRWFGAQSAAPQGGRDTLEGHSISDTLPGATAIVELDLSRFGRGIEEQAVVQPQEARYLRFTVLKARELNGRAVDTIVRELRVYTESPEQVEQGTKHEYTLDTEKAELTFRTELRNYGDAPQKARIAGKILPNGPEFEQEVSLDPYETSTVAVPLTLPSPRLWWPNTYGEQYLYTAEVRVFIGAGVSDKKRFRFGVRRFDYPTDGGLLTLYCNGVRIVAKGGNWGIDDGLKRDDAAVLRDKVRLHAEANMTMIRNWVGMTSHPGFYDACDEYGVLIWDDFWLANPVDGPEPNDPAMFLENAADKIRAVRSHPSLVFYCGRNEGNPREDINEGLLKLTKELDGTRLYFPHSAAAPVGSGGGYSLAKPGQAYGVKQYFNDVTSCVLRSERGIPNVPDLDSVRKFVRPEHLWPISETWALHDWTYHMNGPANTYMEAVKGYLGGDFTVPEDHVQGQAPRDDDPVFIKYKADIAGMCREAGEAWTVEDFFEAAQMINYDHHRGMFDALSARLSNGLLMWMSQSSWPSFMWQTYDYYLHTNGGFYGAKAGCQPVRAFFDPRTDRILLSNATPRRYEDVSVREELYDLYGRPVHTNVYEIEELSPDAYGVPVSTADFSDSRTDLVFLRLTLCDREGKAIGANLYWHNRKDYQNYTALRTIPKTEVTLSVVKTIHEENEDGTARKTFVTLKVENGESPALNVRIRVKDEDGTDVLPVFMSDNYLLLMPGEVREITAEFNTGKVNGSPVFSVTAWNL